MVTQKYIAQHLGISQSAVAAAFHPTLNRYVSPQKRQHIVDTAHRMGYVPHHAARRLARARAHSCATSFDQVGLLHLYGNVSALDSVCLAMLSGAEPELSRLNASLTFIRISNAADWSKVERLARAGGMDGWLIYGTLNDEDRRRLESTALPFVVLGDHHCSEPVPSVNIDNEAVGRLAVEHLHAQGHRRIACMVGNLRFVHQTQTLAGFRDARRQLGLIDDDPSITNLQHWPDISPATILAWLHTLGEMPTGIFMPDRGTAAEISRVFQVSQHPTLTAMSRVTSHSASTDDLPSNFTRVEMPMTEVGRGGALLLHRLVIQGARASATIKIFPSLIEGGSTRPLASTKGL